MKKLLLMLFIIVIGISLLSCSTSNETFKVQKVGMLLEQPIEDDPWNVKGFDGLLQIKKDYNIDIFYKEEVQTRSQIIAAVDQFVKNGVNLIFGHSHIYGRFFTKLTKEYPNVRFVYFNGGPFSDNVISVNFNSLAMGFFSGMLASKMSKTKHIGVIAANKWQSEIEGFYEGAKFQDPSTTVHIRYINDGHHEDFIANLYDQMVEEKVDVFYPASIYFSEMIAKKASDSNLYVIGYFDDQSHIDPTFVLTSTVQHVDKVYPYIVKRLNDQKLNGGIHHLDFQHEFISLDEFSDQVPEDYQNLLSKYIGNYVETELLPYEQ